MTAATRTFDELSSIDASNVVRCARALLRRPLLREGTPDGDLLPMIYRQRAALHEVFSALLGYRLVVERRFARLYKSGPGADATRGEPSLTPRGYAYLALTLATLTGIGRQVLLSRLVTDVRAAAVEAGVPVVDDPADRRALTAALRHLVALGVISETEGTVTATDSTAEALITIDTDLLGQLPAGPIGTADGPAELVAAAAQAGPRSVEHVVRRRLVEDPVVLYADLPAEQRDWLLKNFGVESRLLERFFGLVTEVRSEGVVVSDPEDYLTDTPFPGTGTVARVALLALPRLLELGEPRESDGRHPVTRDQLAEVCADLVESYPAAWSRQATEEPAELVRSVADLLRRLGVLRGEAADGTATTGEDHGELTWWLSPAAHRWLPEPDATPAPGREPEPPPAPEPPGLSLFDDLEEDGAR
ncbi:TIGR02678 family protein [Saccharopolyspora gregorii]|uniref:TIGR02678 family protein n=1 Tax=Saccharopolyspora gregorii TaxID=33914 RepID=UPI0021AC0A87|nr:TIGR02678 family protein [Saccharopolyspora gregorii]